MNLLIEIMELENHFPNLRYTPWSLTSPRTPEYNCIAWAASENDRWWWPDKAGLAYWPDEVPREVTLDAFIAAYGTLGYKTCDDDKLESVLRKSQYILIIGAIPHMRRVN
uniref:DUF7689 domain-containing protein n=1 Tax=Paenibacillus apii TaxID=1850370 RepID=UPI0019824F4B|nr:hypothetical protein [Paenibacillus apii]